MKAKDITLIQTCGACPEQYDAYYKEECIGYLRLRHGYFRVEYKGKLCYDAHTKGDGCFDSDEREYYIKKARKALKEKYLNDIPNFYDV